MDHNSSSAQARAHTHTHTHTHAQAQTQTQQAQGLVQTRTKVLPTKSGSTRGLSGINASDRDKLKDAVSRNDLAVVEVCTSVRRSEDVNFGSCCVCFAVLLFTGCCCFCCSWCRRIVVASLADVGVIIAVTLCCHVCRLTRTSVLNSNKPTTNPREHQMHRI